MTGRCICCDLPVESCGKAIEVKETALGREIRQAVAHTPGWSVAKYGGACERCREWYVVGEFITYDKNALGWSATCCFDIIEKERAAK